ncbi:TolC family protein [Candidatus Sulfidibacterium hydrothermale]|uniref:TolC family protein n=1 Tax=Candidatus Sulfidibacterium hydrothermale TaxID=2875962 RepID=UPI001F0AB820|nr:TolC family protein [Candidatus Sulfidibacterium hydrothermale]UBM62939.1 TolC family protein [Candidatus Sulfidibacterium hydrothermale]
MKKIILVLFAFLFFSKLPAQSVKRYTLAQVIHIAQKQSPDALIAIHQFRKSYWQYRTFKATYLPNLNLSATLPDLNRSINAISAPDGTVSYTSQSIANYSLGLSLNQKIGLTGGEVFVNTGLQRMDNFFTDTSTRQYLSNVVNIGFIQPLFTYNPYKWQKKIEPIKYEEAKRKYMEAEEDIAIKAINYFFSLLTAQIEQKIAIKNYHNYDTLYRIAKGRYNLGKIAENDLLQLQLNLLKADASVEQSRLNYNDKLFRFKSFLRLKDSGKVELVPPLLISFFNVPVDKAVEEAKLNTSTSLQFTQRLLEAASQLDMARMNGRFDMNLYASFGLSQTAHTLQEAYQSPLNQERVSMGITLPLLDWGKAKGNIKMAESNEELVKTAVQQDKIDFEQNIYLKVMQFAMQKKQLAIAAKADTVAQKRYEITHKRYMIGMVNDVLELNNAQIDNDNAKLNYFNTLKKYWINYYELRKLTLYDFQKDVPITVDTKLLVN